MRTSSMIEAWQYISLIINPVAILKLNINRITFTLFHANNIYKQNCMQIRQQQLCHSYSAPPPQHIVVKYQQIQYEMLYVTHIVYLLVRVQRTSKQCNIIGTHNLLHLIFGRSDAIS